MRHRGYELYLNVSKIKISLLLYCAYSMVGKFACEFATKKEVVLRDLLKQFRIDHIVVKHFTCCLGHNTFNNLDTMVPIAFSYGNGIDTVS